jgi:hypothetical protein
MALLSPFYSNMGAKRPKSAAQNFEELTREQWLNYMNTYVPIENQLIEQATNPELVTQAMDTASQNVNQSFDSQQGATQRRLRGLGLQLTTDQQVAADRATNLSRSLADVNAQNVAKDLTTRRQQSILGNPAPQ